MSVPDAKVEMQIGDVQTDISADVYGSPGISHTRGRSGEGARVDPSVVSMQLKSPDGKYDRRNPRSPNYGLLGQNTPLRMTAQGLDTVLVLPADQEFARATTPDHASLDITGDLDVRIEAQYDGWEATGSPLEMIGKYNAGTSQRSWMLTLWMGRILFYWSEDGTTATEQSEASPVLPVPTSRRLAIRVTLDVDNGAGGCTVTFYTSDTMAGPWEQLGTPTIVAGTTSILGGASALTVGAAEGVSFSTADGQVYAAEVRSGISGTVVAAPDFTAQTPGTTGFTDSAGRLWTMTNGATTAVEQLARFMVEIPTWSPRFEMNGADMYVPIQGGGILRRLSQGQKALESTLRRRIPTYSPLAYWPMEEGSAATQAYSPIAGVNPMSVTDLSFASESSLAGSGPLPTLGDNGRFFGGVRPGADGAWQVELVYSLDAMPTTLTTMLLIRTTGSTPRILVQIQTNNVKLIGQNAAGDEVWLVNLTAPDFTGQWNRLQVMHSTSGGTITAKIGWITIGEGGQAGQKTYSGTAGHVTSVETQPGAALQGMGIGHVAVFEAANMQLAYAFADRGFSGETAGTRLLRLTAEEGVPFQLVGDASDQTPMGPQRPDTLLNLLAECEAADGGMLHEDRTRIGLVYRGRTSLYNQAPTLVLPYSRINQPFEPVDDDQRIRNDVTRSRPGGSSARVVRENGPLSVQAPPLGVGTYDESVSVNVDTDDQLEQIAGWNMSLGTWDEARYKQLRILLHKHRDLIPAVAALDVGSIIRVTDLPEYWPPGPIDLMVEGYREDLTSLTWDITFACSPAGPWTVGVVEDPVLGRADTDGSELATSATASATTLSVAVTDGPLWVTAAPNVIVDPGFEEGVGTWACTRGSSIGVVSWEQTTVHSGAGAARITRVHATDTGTLDLNDSVNGDVPAAAGQVWQGSAWVLSAGAAANSMRASVIWRDSVGAETNVSGAGVSTSAGDGWVRLSITATAPAGTVSVRLLLEGRSAWTVGEYWIADDVRLARTDTLVGTDMGDQFPFEVTVGGEVVNVHGISGTSSPQTFYVDRSRNGVSKAQAVNTSLSLTHPMRAAL